MGINARILFSCKAAFLLSRPLIAFAGRESKQDLYVIV
jgi:hypothetical protein